MKRSAKESLATPPWRPAGLCPVGRFDPVDPNPFVVATFRDDAIEIDSQFLLLDFAQVDFYHHQATTLSERNGDGREVLVGEDGTIQGMKSLR